MDRPDDLELFVETLRSAVLIALMEGKPNVGRVAGLTGVSVRTLQRRLGALGTTYSRLVEELRYDAARKLLRETDLPVVAVAEALGYADATAFSRAFRRWSGGCPRNYRMRQRSPGSGGAAPAN